MCIVSNFRSLFWAVEESFSIYIDWWMRRRKKNTNSKVEKPSGLQIWHKEWYGYLIIPIHQPWSWPFSMLHFQSIDKSICIYNLWYNTLFVSLQKKNNTYFYFSKFTQKEMSFATSFPTLFHLVSRNHVAVASLTRCLVAEFVGNRKVMSLKMVNGFQTSNWMKFSPENQPPNPGFTHIFSSIICTGTICGGKISENV